MTITRLCYICQRSHDDDSVTFDHLEVAGNFLEPEYCGVYWIITTCLTAIAIGAAFGVACWLLVLS